MYDSNGTRCSNISQHKTSNKVEDNNPNLLCNYSTNKRDSEWDNKRTLTQTVEGIFADGEAELHQKHAERMAKCTGRLMFGWNVDQTTGEAKMQLKKTLFCKVRSCPVCQWRRQLVWQARAFTMLPKVKELYPKHRWLFLTLTVENVPTDELKETIKTMQDAWSKLRKRKNFPAIGYIKSLEVTRSANGFAHPHFHVLLLVPSSYFGKNYIPQLEWREMWGDCLRVSYLPVVHIQTVKSKNPNDPHDVGAAVVETLKYETKAAELEKHPEFLRAIALQLVRVRAVEVGGVLKAIIKEDEAMDDEMIRPSDEEKLENLQGLIGFNWNRQIKHYVKK